MKPEKIIHPYLCTEKDTTCPLVASPPVRALRKAT